MQALLKAFFRYLAEVAASEAGELLSVRRKSHLLEARRYALLTAPSARAKPADDARRHAPARCRQHKLTPRHAH